MRSLVLIVAACLLAPSLHAQSTAGASWPPDSGTRIRVYSPALDKGPIVGTLLSVDSEALRLRGANAESATTIPVASLARLEVAAGKRQHKAQGALLGFVVGALAGAVLGAATYSDKSCVEFCFGPGLDAAVGGILGGVVGTVAGISIGARSVETWVPVSVPGR
jgi:hypothetical protein